MKIFDIHQANVLSVQLGVALFVDLNYLCLTLVLFLSLVWCEPTQSIWYYYKFYVTVNTSFLKLGNHATLFVSYFRPERSKWLSVERLFTSANDLLINHNYFQRERVLIYGMTDVDSMVDQLPGSLSLEVFDAFVELKILQVLIGLSNISSGYCSTPAVGDMPALMRLVIHLGHWKIE